MISSVAAMRPKVRVVMCLASALSVAACAPMRTAGTPTPPAGTTAPAAGTAAAGAAAASKVPMATAKDGTKIAYEVTGTGPALMLVPGGGQTRGTWKDRGYVERLSKSYTVITLDLRGTGDSDKPAKPGRTRSS